MAQPVVILLCCAAIIGLSLNQIKWNEENSDSKLFVNSSNGSDARGQFSIEDLFRAKNCSAIRLINLANEHTEMNITDASTNYQGPRKNSDHGTDDASNQQFTEKNHQQNVSFHADDFFENYSLVYSQNESRNCTQPQEKANESHNETANASNKAVGGSNTSYSYEDSLQSDQSINDSSSQVKNVTRDASIHETDSDTNSASRNRSSSTGWENGSYSETSGEQASNSLANQYSQESSSWSFSYGSQNGSQYQETMNESHNVPANASHQAVGESNSSYGYEDSLQSDQSINDSSSQVKKVTRDASIHETDSDTNSASRNRSSSTGWENGSYSETWGEQASNSLANQYSQESSSWSFSYGSQNGSQYQETMNESHNVPANASHHAVGESNSSYGYEDSLQSDQSINDSSSQVKNVTRDASIHETDSDTNSASWNRSSSTGWENGSYSETWGEQASNSSANQYSQESSSWSSSYGSQNGSQYQETMNESHNVPANASHQAVGESNSSYGYEDSLQSDQSINDSSSQVKNVTRDASIHETDSDTNSASRNRSSSTGWENGSYSETWGEQASNSSPNQYSQESSSWSSSYGSQNGSQYQETMNESHNVPANASHQAVGESNSSYGYEDSLQSDQSINDSSSQVKNVTRDASIDETDSDTNSASRNRSSSTGWENGSYSKTWEEQASNFSANQYSQESSSWSSSYGSQNGSQYQETMNESHNVPANASHQAVGGSNFSYGYEDSWQSGPLAIDPRFPGNNDTQGASIRETYNSGNSASGNRSSSTGGENDYYSATSERRTSNSSANQYSQESSSWSSSYGSQNGSQYQETMNESHNVPANASHQAVGGSNFSYGYEDSWQSGPLAIDASFPVNNDTQGASIRETYNSGNSASGNRSSSTGGENDYYSETSKRRTSNSSANQYSQEFDDWNYNSGNQHVVWIQGTVNESHNQTGNASGQSAGESNSSYDYEEDWPSDQPINDSSFQMNNDTQGATIRETYNSGNSASGNRSSSTGGGNDYNYWTWEQWTSNSSANQYSQESGSWSSYNKHQDDLQFQGTTNESRNRTGNASAQSAEGSNSSYGYEDSRQSHSGANTSARNGTISSINDFSNNDQNESDNSSSGNAEKSSSELRVQCEGEVDHLTPIIDVSRSQRLFALGLYKTIRWRGPANLAVSTANTFFSLAEISYGAAEQTRAELQFALQLPSPYCYDPLLGYEDSMDRIRTFNKAGVALAHGIYLSPEYEVSNEFRSVVNASFHSKVNRLTNRGSPAKWFTKNGNPFGMLLSNFVSAENIHGNESIILLNGAYIKGSWLNKFNRCTEKIKIDGGSSYGVSESPSMQSVGKFNYGKLPDVDASFIEMPLADGDNSGHGALFIILPNEAHGLDKLESEMNEDTISQQIFNGNSETVNVILPEFIIEYHSNLVATLRQMNLNKMFSDEADFRTITVSGRAKVDLVLHKLVIHGRKTSRPTSCASNVSAEASDDATIQFKADHPFLIVVAIRDENPIIVSIARFAVANDNF